MISVFLRPKLPLHSPHEQPRYPLDSAFRQLQACLCAAPQGGGDCGGAEAHGTGAARADLGFFAVDILSSYVAEFGTLE